MNSMTMLEGGLGQLFHGVLKSNIGKGLFSTIAADDSVKIGMQRVGAMQKIFPKNVLSREASSAARKATLRETVAAGSSLFKAVASSNEGKMIGKRIAYGTAGYGSYRAYQGYKNNGFSGAVGGALKGATFGSMAGMAWGRVGAGVGMIKSIPSSIMGP